jgi:hypothetical protein
LDVSFSDSGFGEKDAEATPYAKARRSKEAALPGFCVGVGAHIQGKT